MKKVKFEFIVDAADAENILAACHYQATLSLEHKLETYVKDPTNQVMLDAWQRSHDYYQNLVKKMTNTIVD